MDAVLSLACGAGVQTMAAVYDPLPVIPALNTTFLGANIKQGIFQEMCRGCGDCVLAYTGYCFWVFRGKASHEHDPAY